MPKLLLFICIVFSGTVCAQERTLISGSITTTDFLPIEAHIWNKTQNQGSLSTEVGSFEMNVRVGDTLRISSMGYQTTAIIIQQRHLEESITIPLEIAVNELQETQVFQYGLTGDMSSDVHKITPPVSQLPYFNAKTLKRKRVSRPSDDFSPVQNPLLVHENQTRTNLVPLVNAIVKLFVKERVADTPLDFALLFDERFITQNLDIPETQYHDFMDHLKEQKVFEEILETKDPLKILEFVLLEKEQFLAQN